MPREGIFIKVLEGGIIKSGDEIEVVEYGVQPTFKVKK